MELHQRTRPIFKVLQNEWRTMPSSSWTESSIHYGVMPLKPSSPLRLLMEPTKGKGRAPKARREGTRLGGRRRTRSGPVCRNPRKCFGPMGRTYLPLSVLAEHQDPVSPAEVLYVLIPQTYYPRGNTSPGSLGDILGIRRFARLTSGP